MPMCDGSALLDPSSLETYLPEPTAHDTYWPKYLYDTIDYI